MALRHDYTGERHGRVEVLGRIAKGAGGGWQGGCTLYSIRCDCGAVFEASSQWIKNRQDDRAACNACVKKDRQGGAHERFDNAAARRFLTRPLVKKDKTMADLVRRHGQPKVEAKRARVKYSGDW